MLVHKRLNRRLKLKWRKVGLSQSSWEGIMGWRYSSGPKSTPDLVQSHSNPTSFLCLSTCMQKRPDHFTGLKIGRWCRWMRMMSKRTKSKSVCGKCGRKGESERTKSKRLQNESRELQKACSLNWSHVKAEGGTFRVQNPLWADSAYVHSCRRLFLNHIIRTRIRTEKQLFRLRFTYGPAASPPDTALERNTGIPGIFQGTSHSQGENVGLVLCNNNQKRNWLNS